MATRAHSCRTAIARWLLASCAGLAVLLASWITHAAGESAVSEQQVKAVLLFRIAKFIQWPADSFSSATAPFVLCVVSDDRSVLDAFQPVEGKTIDRHPLTVRRVVGDVLDLQKCHVAFFPTNTAADVDYAISKLQSLPVLTVGETEDFAQRGGVLALATREQRVRFVINLPASRRARLQVNAQLLEVAIVIGAGASS